MDFFNIGVEDSNAFRIYMGATERMLISSGGDTTFAGDVGMGKLTATKSGTAGVFNSGTTNVVASFTSTDGTGVIQLADSGGNVEIGAAGNDFVVQPAGGVAQLTVGSSSSTFAGDVDVYKTTDSQLQIKSLNEDATLIINSGADGVGGANREEGFIKFYQANADFWTLGKRNQGYFSLYDHTAGQYVMQFGDNGAFELTPANNIATITSNVAIKSAGGNNVPADLSLWHSDVSIVSGDGIGVISAEGSDSGGSPPYQGAKILFDASANWDTGTSNYYPTNIKFFTQDNSGTDTISAGARMTIGSDGNSTFAGDVTIGSTGAGSDKILNILTGGSDSTIKLMEAGTVYGFSQVYSGANNQFYIKRHSNSATGSAVITLNRDDDNATFAGKVVVGKDSSNALEVFSSGDTEIGFSYATQGNIYAKIIGDITTASPLGGELAFQTATGGTLAERMRITSAGALEIQGTATSGANKNAFITNSDTLTTIGSTQSAGTPKDMAFYTGAERMRLTSGGDVLFRGTSVPSASNLVGSGFKFDSKSRMTLKVQASDNNNLTDLQEYFNTDGAVGKIQTNGTATLFTTSSDYRLKEKIYKNLMV